MSGEQDEFTVDLEDITPSPENIRPLPAKLRLWHALVSHLIAVILVGLSCCQYSCIRFCYGKFLGIMNQLRLRSRSGTQSLARLQDWP